MPAVGVTVMVKSSGMGTITDEMGKYDIEISDNGVLVFLT